MVKCNLAGRKSSQPHKDLGKEHSSWSVLHMKGLQVEMILAHSQTSVIVTHTGPYQREQQSPGCGKTCKPCKEPGYQVLCEAMGGLNGKQRNEVMDLPHRLSPRTQRYHQHVISHVEFTRLISIHLFMSTNKLRRPK